MTNLRDAGQKFGIIPIVTIYYFDMDSITFKLCNIIFPTFKMASH